MKVSYNWLKDYIKTDLSPEKMSEILTDTGLEVEGLEKVGKCCKLSYITSCGIIVTPLKFKSNQFGT